MILVSCEDNHFPPDFVWAQVKFPGNFHPGKSEIRQSRSDLTKGFTFLKSEFPAVKIPREFYLREGLV